MRARACRKSLQTILAAGGMALVVSVLPCAAAQLPVMQVPVGPGPPLEPPAWFNFPLPFATLAPSLTMPSDFLQLIVGPAPSLTMPPPLQLQFRVAPPLDMPAGWTNPLVGPGPPLTLPLGP